MPELPDVEIFKRYFDSYGLDKKVEKVKIRSEQVLGNLRPKGLGAALTGKKFSSSLRHGKHLLVSTTGEEWLGFHFGMTGFFEYLDPGEDPGGHPRILFQAGIHPRVEASNLSQAKIGDLYDEMKYVLEKAIAREVEADSLPSNFLLPHRTPGTACPQCGENIEKVKVSGRSAYFCPACQSTPNSESDS
ncbi:hypothetical protein K9M78_01630 [Candidatus Bipolaricaulota bacterium]|nr:hypothetical protein [Candidatus Bipolaricaulota bacterium]